MLIAFVAVLLGLAALAINLFHVGLPTCLTDIKPFQKGELITHSPTHYELHYVARMWKFEPEDVTVPAGSTVDIYVSTPDVTHGLILLGTNLNLMAVPGVVNYARVKFDQAARLSTALSRILRNGSRPHGRRIARGRRGDVRRETEPRRLQQEPTDPGYKLLEAKTVHDLPFDRRSARHRPDIQRNSMAEAKS